VSCAPTSKGGYTAKPVRASRLHHYERQEPAAQRVHRLGTDDGGVGIADDLPRFRLQRRAAARGDQAGADEKHQRANDALHPTVIRPRYSDRDIETLDWASVPGPRFGTQKAAPLAPIPLMARRSARPLDAEYLGGRARCAPSQD